ncbi:MAG TPA: leucyl aminopeptidase [Candidatus Angelobacter sp.]
METKLIAGNAADVESECLVVVALDHGEKQKNEARLAHRDVALEKTTAELLATGEVTSKQFEAVLVHRPQDLKAKRLLVVNAGKAKNFNATNLRRAAGTALRFLKPKMIKNCALLAPEISGGTEEAVRCLVEGALVADFDPDTYCTDRKDLSMEEITIVVPGGSNVAVAERALGDARIVGESQNFARELVNEPSNRMTPTILADRAREMCESSGLKCEIFGPDKIKELKMGAFWSVAQGSDEEPRLIVIRYEPAGAPEKPVLGLVGKGVTFDTGGISIKPADGMEKMKYDMAGGAAMLGAMRAIGLLKPKVKVIGIVCATENMPSGRAQKPGDIQMAMSGKAIEIINTDAEGRLVLADGLHYARTLGCTHLVDAATLTGACVIALGMVNAGVFANNEEAYQRFCKAVERSGEKFWRLPLDQEYFEQIRSSIADIMNSGGRYGGAINAAMFLKEFVDDTPWIHLDIAGVAWMEDRKAWMAKGPSGIGVRSLVEFVKGFSS